MNEKLSLIKKSKRVSIGAHKQKIVYSKINGKGEKMLDWRDTLKEDNEILNNLFEALQKLENIKDENLLTDLYTCYADSECEASSIEEFIFNLSDLIALNVDKLKELKSTTT